MEPKVRYALVGLFVVLLGAGALTIFIWLTRGAERVEYAGYYVLTKESVAGLTPGASVKYLGVDVGRVSAIDIDPKNTEEVRLTLAIAKGTPIKEDTTAVLKSQGLTGLVFVELEGGSRDAPALTAEPGRKYPVIRSSPSTLYRIDQALSVLAGDLTALMKDARAVLDRENRERLARVLNDLAEITDTFARRRDALDRGIVQGAEAAESLSRTAGQLEERVPEILGRLDAAAAALADMGVELSRTAKDVGRAGRGVEELVERNRTSIDRFASRTLPEIGALAAELRRLAASMERVSRRLEEDPGSLLFGSRPGPPGPGEERR